MKRLIAAVACAILSGCGAHPARPESKSLASQSAPPSAISSQVADGGWRPFESALDFDDTRATAPERAPATVSDHPMDHSSGPLDRHAAAYSGNRDLVASAVTDVALQRLGLCCGEIPERDDLQLVLQAALHSVAAPDFDAYNALMVARGCELLSSVDAQCRDLWRFINFGYSEAQWAELTLTEKARAYWNTLDQRKARWLAADLSRVVVGTDPRSIPRQGAGQIMSYSFFRPPGGFESFHEDMTTTVFVHVQLNVERGVVPMTFCFAFHPERRKWYPWWTLIQHPDSGPATVIRF